MSNMDVDTIKQEIRSLLVSAKSGLSERELLADYRMFNSNKEIPFKELGYSSLISLLRTWPDVCRFQQQGNTISKILAVEEESTKHILSMVRGQRQNKSRRRGRGGRNRARGGEAYRTGTRDNRGASFWQNTLTSTNSRSGNVGSRGGAHVRTSASTSRSAASFRFTTGQSNQNSRNQTNSAGPPRFNKQQQQQIRFYLTSSTQSRKASYELKASANPNLLNDRQVINNSTSLRITMNGINASNRTTEINEISENLPSSCDIPSQYSAYMLNEDEEQLDEEDVDREEEALNNLRSLLTEYTHGIRLLALDQLYQEKFGRSLLTELNLSNILLLQDIVDDFASISRHDEENGSCDHIITMKDPKQIAQTQSQYFQQITNSGIVPRTFRYANNLISYIKESRFQGHVSNIDKKEHCFHIQPVRYQEHIETLMEELHSYYSNPTSNSLIINNIETGMSCVTTYDGAYHRVFIKETDLYKCVIVYVDYGTIHEVNKDEQTFKYLLTHFAELPCMAIVCRLDDIRFIPDDDNWPPDTYAEVYRLCKDGPFFIEPTGYTNGLLTIKILDADEQCLNDILVQLNRAVRISTCPSQSSLDNNQVQQQNAPKPVELNFDFLAEAAQCPLPDSDPPTPESKSVDAELKLPDGASSQIMNYPGNIKQQCKLIQIDENRMFYLIRHHDNDRPYIPCFSLASLFHVSESDILSETLLSRILLQHTNEYNSVFEFFKQSNPTECLHIHKGFLFLFDIISILKYLEQFDLAKDTVITEALRQQMTGYHESHFWDNVYDCFKLVKNEPSKPSDPCCDQIERQRYQELISRRNILCNMLRAECVNECTTELGSIEDELEQLVRKMRVGTASQQLSRSLSTPSSLTMSSYSDQKSFIVNKNDRLKELMERCKKLINTILVLDDFIPIDDHITQYIESQLPFLTSGKHLQGDDELYQQYSDLLKNLTFIVNGLHHKLQSRTDF